MKQGLSNTCCRSIANAFLFAALAVNGQTNGAAPQDLRATATAYSQKLQTDLRAIREASMTSDYALRELAILTDKIGPRLSGSQQAQDAIDHVAGELRRLGLDVRMEAVTVPRWQRGTEAAEIIKFSGQMSNTSQKITLTALGGSIATPPGGVDADVIVVSSFEELSALEHTRIVGKIVIFNCRFDQQMAAQGSGLEAYRQTSPYRVEGANAAARLGAVAVLVRSLGGANYRLAHTGFLRYTKDTPQIPAAAVTAEDADLVARLAKDGPVRLHLLLRPQTLPNVESHNVIADIKGTEHPEQIVIISGHLDSWDLGTGATDDAAGVAIAMQAAETLRRLNLKPKRTIRFIAWMGEEFGGLGGKAYAKEHAGEMPNHFAAIESDHGAGHPLGFTFKADRTVEALLAPVSALLQSSGAGLMEFTEDVETDISPLADAGVPCFGLWQDGRTYFDYHHTAADTFDKVVPKELAENATVMSVLAYALANIPAR